MEAWNRDLKYCHMSHLEWIREAKREAVGRLKHIGAPKEARIPDCLREIGQKLYIEHTDRFVMHDTARVFLCENGTSGVGPENIQVGDLVCQFPDPCYPLLLRNRGAHYEVIGKSANCDPLLSSRSDEHNTKLRVYDSRGCPINFYMNRRFLRYCRNLSSLELDFKNCAETSALGRTLTREDLHRQYGI